jgi:hypothetical protein
MKRIIMDVLVILGLFVGVAMLGIILNYFNNKTENFGRLASYGWPYYQRFNQYGCANADSHYDSYDYQPCHQHSHNVVYIH